MTSTSAGDAVPSGKAASPLLLRDVGRGRSTTPIYVGNRRFLGRRDLVISFYTQKCQFSCSYCALPLASSNEPVAATDLNAQIDFVFASKTDLLGRLEQLSFGNEGSALDPRRFHRESLHRLLDYSTSIRRLAVLSIETRPEYVKGDVLEDILGRTNATSVEVTVGFETQDDRIRREVLRKNISRRVMEERIRLLGDLGVGLTAYVMLKPAPGMTEEDGVREAVSTIEYLAALCDRAKVPFTAYLNPTYIAEGSLLARTRVRELYTPPKIQSVFKVLLASHRMGVPTYVGLWSEGLAGPAGDYRTYPDYDPQLRNAILEFGRTDDFGHLAAFVDAVG
ncbi:hypothetical protein [Kribbella ginsengisoli]|uniref:Elp3/MiaA/NifB-like radical SAM core domain-containing protein n=1 Tax=Kribbella ginsengisoli TaxID=363865 RepID=A0ABP6YEX3_9ACTN